MLHESTVVSKQCFHDSFFEGPLPQLLQASPRAGLGGSGIPPQTSSRAGAGGSRKTSATAMWPASSDSEAKETAADQCGHSCLPSYGCSQGKRDCDAACFVGEQGRGDNPAATAATVVPFLTVTAQPLLAATITVMAQHIVASSVTAPVTQWGPWYTPQVSNTPWGGLWFPTQFMGRFPRPSQRQQPLPPWLQPLSSLKQLATLGLAQALPARMPFWPGSAPHPPSSGSPLVPSTGSQHPGGATLSALGLSLCRSSWQQAPLQPGSSLAQQDPIPPQLDHAPESDDDSSQGSEWDGASERGFDEPPADQQLWSFAALLAQLGEYAPFALVDRGEASQSQAPCLTAAELALGAVAQPSTSPPPPGLHKSAMVAMAVSRVQDTRPYNPEACPESVPDFPGAFPPGKFVRPGKPAFTKGLPLSHSAIPSATLCLSQDDMLLIPERSRLSKVPRPTSIPERLLVNWQEMDRRGLETTSVMDSFLSGLVGALRDPESDSFQLHQDLDAPAILALIQTLAQGLKASADISTRLHFNPILARRDSTLSASSVVRTPGLHTSIRTLPVGQDGLFNNHVQAVIRRQADVNRDMAFHAAVPHFTSAAPCQPAKCNPSGDYARLGSVPHKARKGNSPRGRGPGHRPPRPFQKPPASKWPHPQWLTPSLAHPPAPCLLAGSLSSHVLAWETLPVSDWVVRVIRLGFRLPWCSAKVPLSTSPLAFWPPGNPLALGALDQEVAMEEVASSSSPGLYGRIFVVPKASGGWRPVLDLSPLNVFLRNVPFQMETAASLRDAMHPGDWATSIDLRDAYFHLLIHPHDQKWLRFVWRDKIFQFCALFFGLAPAPWIFMKVTRELCLHVRARGISLRVYLDDWLVLASSQELCSSHSQQVLHLCRSLGFPLNEEKSDLRPSQHFELLGMTFDTLRWLVFPAPHRTQRLQSLLSFVLHRDWATARELASLLGQMESFAPLVPLGRMHKRKFQRLFRDCWCQARHPWDLHIPLGEWFPQFTSQWGKIEWLSQGVPITLPSPQEHLYTDASVMGWGAHVGPLTASGHWPEHMMSCHINLLELEAAFQTLSFTALWQAGESSSTWTTSRWHVTSTSRGEPILGCSGRERRSFFCGAPVSPFSCQPCMFWASWTFWLTSSVDHTWSCSRNGLLCTQYSSQFGQPGSHLTSTSSPLGLVIACHCMCPQFQTRLPGLWSRCPFLGQISCSVPSHRFPS